MSNEDIEALRRAMRAASPAGRGSYVAEGQHHFEVKLATCKRTNIQGTWKETYLIEFVVLASSNATHEVGSTRTYAESPKNTGWMDRFKACLAACCGVDPSQKLSPEIEETISDMIAALRYDEFRISKGWPENFLKGRRVFCEGSVGASQKGTPVTNKKWTPSGDA